MPQELDLPNKHHTPEEVETALLTLALNSGNARRTERKLKQVGVNVGHSTLSRWKHKHLERYEQLREDVITKVKAKAAETHHNLAEQEMELAGEFLQDLKARKADLEPRDLSAAIRNLDVGSGIHTQRASELRGDEKPPTISINFQASAESWARDGAKFFDADGNELSPQEAAAQVIEGSATEVPASLSHATET